MPPSSSWRARSACAPPGCTTRCWRARGTLPSIPEPATAADLDADKARVLAEMQVTFDLLEASAADLPDATRELARAMLAARPRIESRILATSNDPSGLQKIRIHGDYHLGQVLVTKNDFVIIDFEGEPGRDFAARRAKQSPLRDVAGMLRSFSYAQHSALRASVASDAEVAAMAPPLAAWEAQVREAFLAGYAGAIDARLWPRDVQGPQGLLGLYVLEKALYELRYELSNRPDWVDIPLTGVLELAATDPTRKAM